VGPEDVGLDEVAGGQNRAVDVRLRREVDDRLAAGRRLGNGRGIGDVPVEEGVVDTAQVGRVPGVRELV
jgi:hypothetical protein